MDLPIELVGAVVGEGEKYFFTVDCPIGIQDHIHICIKRKQDFIVFYVLFPDRYCFSSCKVERA